MHQRSRKVLLRERAPEVAAVAEKYGGTGELTHFSVHCRTGTRSQKLVRKAPPSRLCSANKVLSHGQGGEGQPRDVGALKQKSTSSAELMLPSGGSDRRRSGDLSIFSRTLYQLSYRA